MSRRALYVAFMLTGLAGCVPNDSSDAVRNEVQKFVRSYLEALNKADATATMEMFKRDAATTSVADGEIDRGWNDIRDSKDAATGKEGTFKYSLGAIETAPLGTQHALAVVPVTYSLQTAVGTDEAQAALTLVVEKSPTGWKIVHEHYSTQAEPTAE